MHTIQTPVLLGRSRVRLGPSRGTQGHRATGWVVKIWQRLLAAQARMNDRRSLADLDARLLADIGLTPDDVAREVTKPFWRS